MSNRQFPWTSTPGLDPNSLFDLTGGAAVVIGAGGVGGWLAAALSVAGAETVVADIDPAKVDHFVQQMGENGRSIAGFAGDATQSSTIDSLFQFVADNCSQPLRTVVNTAAVNRRQPAIEVDPETYQRIMGVDLQMPFFVSRAAAKAMIGHGEGGSIIHITSTNARFGLQSTSVYAAAKAGLDQLARTLAVEWAPYGIRVNCIAPGFLMTDLSRPLWEDPDKEDWILGRVPLRRPGSPSELVGACLLLASSAGSFITGQTITVDGGFLAGNSWLPDD